MAEVRKKTTTRTKKSSKILDQYNGLTNDELLEQIMNKKKNKVSKRSTTPKVSGDSKTNVKKSSSTKIKKNVEKKETISSDKLYDQIKSKKILKKLASSKNKGKDVSFRKAIREIETEDTDLIITREISFDDLSANLKKKKNLKELREAIEAFDKLDDFEAKSGKTEEDYYLLPFIKRSNKHLKKFILSLSCLILFVAVVIGAGIGINEAKNDLEATRIKNEEKQRIAEEKRRLEEEVRKKKKLFNACLEKEYSDFDNTELMLSYMNELSTYLSANYHASVAYEDLAYGYKYSYEEDEVYYAASTVKALGALYVYTKASAGEIDLDDTVTYSSKYKVSYSDGVKNHKLGSKISLRTLVKYSIIYSDNSAHQMIVSYIGRNNLKEFGKSLGAVNTLNGSDNFGHTSAADGSIYMKKLNEFFDDNGELGQELKGYFLDSIQKELSVNNLEVANKYGMYKKYYHNMGIVYDEHPYVISIMTLEGYNDKYTIINDISLKVYDLHHAFYENRKNACNLEIYGQ